MPTVSHPQGRAAEGPHNQWGETGTSFQGWSSEARQAGCIPLLQEAHIPPSHPHHSHTIFFMSIKICIFQPLPGDSCRLVRLGTQCTLIPITNSPKGTFQPRQQPWHSEFLPLEMNTEPDTSISSKPPLPEAPARCHVPSLEKRT